MNIAPIDIYDKKHNKDVFMILFFITHGLILLIYLGRKHHLLIKLSAISTVSVLYLHGLILAVYFSSLLRTLFS